LDAKLDTHTAHRHFHLFTCAAYTHTTATYIYSIPAASHFYAYYYTRTHGYQFPNGISHSVKHA
jgi:hypothetical protein